MIKSAICDLLGIGKPVFQGGMAWISDARLAAAVSNAGGLGLISAVNGGVEAVRAEIRKARTLTDKPFGVNVMLAAPDADEIADLVVEEGVKIVTTGAGSPAPYMDRWLEAGIRVIPVVASVAYARKMQELGAAAVIAEGAEGPQVFHLEVTDPAGKRQAVYAKNYRAEGPSTKIRFQIPFNAARGKWRAEVTQVSTGLKAVHGFTVK